jgi:hypothetical protein
MASSQESSSSDIFYYDDAQSTISQSTISWQPKQAVPSPPAELQRLESGKYVVWKLDYKDTFRQWFETTPWFKTWASKGKPTINWGGRKRKSGEDSPWNYFQEVAIVQTGQPRIVCKMCQLDLSHPSAGHGNHSMNLHLATAACKKSQPENVKAQGFLYPYFKRQVYLSL